MIRKIIKIDTEKCNGCGACANACHEGAIGMIEGKATLLRDDYCDGLGDCLPVCPTGAITFVEREAAAYDEAAVKANQQEKLAKQAPDCGCPGSTPCEIERAAAAPGVKVKQEPELRQWPVQLKLAPINGTYFNGANLLIAADCTAYAYAGFHQDFMRNKVTLIGCPKLDEGDYTEKLTAILRNNDVQSVTVVRMDVPCCAALEHAVRTALHASGKYLPWQVVVLATDGHIVSP